MMPYVYRNAINEITGLSSWPNGTGEYLPDDNLAVMVYLKLDLAGRKAATLASVDAAAEAARAQWITPGSGQALA